MFHFVNVQNFSTLDRNKKKRPQVHSASRLSTCMDLISLTLRLFKVLKGLKTGQLESLGMSLKCITERVCGLNCVMTHSDQFCTDYSCVMILGSSVYHLDCTLPTDQAW